ncbi:MAG: hypothetical protein VX453_02385 [Acidobacteriota bacterium]|nr:hypothetical protein [Acidobacteriota bacterium]
MARFSLAFVTLVLFLLTSSASAQTNVLANRTTACTINPGYSMADVVATARNFEWSEDTSPGVVLMRGKVAAANNPQFDFLIDAYYPSYADMVEKRGAFLQRQAGRNGRRGLGGVATCNDNVRISSVRPAAAPPGGPGAIPPLTAVVSFGCELNGAAVTDAVALANTFGQSVGAGAAVVSRNFGGPSVPFNSRVGMRLFFSSFPDFGASFDRLQQNTQTPNPENPISCNTGSLWASYLIHQRDN